MIRILAPFVLAACLAATAPALAAPPQLVDINKATQAELETVKGIGPAMSAKILAARKSGEFKNWEDLVERVSGLGPGNARRMSQAGLRVAGASFQGSAAAGSGNKPARYVAPERGSQAERKVGQRQAGDKVEPAGRRGASEG